MTAHYQVPKQIFQQIKNGNIDEFQKILAQKKPSRISLPEPSTSVDNDPGLNPDYLSENKRNYLKEFSEYFQPDNLYIDNTCALNLAIALQKTTVTDVDFSGHTISQRNKDFILEVIQHKTHASPMIISASNGRNSSQSNAVEPASKSENTPKKLILSC